MAVLPPGRIHHVALVVRSIEASAVLWRDYLGLKLETIMDIESDRVRIAFLRVGELAPPGSELRRQVEIAHYYLSPALAWVPIAVLSIVVGGANLLRWVVRWSARGPSAAVLGNRMPAAVSGVADRAASPPLRRRA